MTRRTLALALSSLVLVCTACGASDDQGESSGGRRPQTGKEAKPTRQAFVRQANAICAEAWKNAAANLRDAPPEEQFATAMETWDDLVRELRRLHPPAADEARVTRMLAYFEDAVRAGRRVAAADDESVLAPLAGLVDQGSRGAAIARSYGITACSPLPAKPSTEQFFQSPAFQEAMKDFTRRLNQGKRQPLTRP